ncbi:hypothetical protein SAMN06297382_1907 [Amphiplicatus metriothermophilus]|uniref:Uncharacterized protein n=1 Tax=Amphiplicatus metriothermophilus TaxID=1519374 RepID=A0A239PTX1_9PROT|nr:hypothetical protein [Amphiplicatus metriothermophilus]SNT73620.1 hypothetical protein SAMN06297382_1907 [Amphiplicatus metriothermophilus]
MWRVAIAAQGRLLPASAATNGGGAGWRRSQHVDIGLAASTRPAPKAGPRACPIGSALDHPATINPLTLTKVGVQLK